MRKRLYACLPGGGNWGKGGSLVVSIADMVGHGQQGQCQGLSAAERSPAVSVTRQAHWPWPPVRAHFHDPFFHLLVLISWDSAGMEREGIPASNLLVTFLVNTEGLLSLRKTEPCLPHLILKAKHLCRCGGLTWLLENSCFPIEDAGILRGGGEDGVLPLGKGMFLNPGSHA